MSSYELHFGKLRELNYNALGFNTIEEWAKDKCDQLGIIKQSYHDDYWDCIEFTLDNKYVKRGDRLFEVEDKELEDCGDFLNYNINNDGEIEYSMRFYNGGTCLSEMLNEVLEEIEKKKK